MLKKENAFQGSEITQLKETAQNYETQLIKVVKNQHQDTENLISNLQKVRSEPETAMTTPLISFRDQAPHHVKSYSRDRAFDERRSPKTCKVL
jgi:HPt (histidine-containing phosphotransfer) domain-containing protein